MVKPLPRNSQLRLAQALAQWRHWNCEPPLPGAPDVARQLDPGFSNASFLLESVDGRRFVVRLDGVDPAHHGINRQAEWRALHSAHEAGLAARPCYFNPELGALVCDYLPEDRDATAQPEDVGRLLRAIHALPALHHRLDLNERTARYRRHGHTQDGQTNAVIAAVTPAVDKVLEWQRDRDERCLCHNDLLAANRLYSNGRLYALDWEYCAMGSPWFDLAVVCCGDELEEATSERLLQAYLGRAPGENDRQKLAAYSLLYRHIEVLWFVDVGSARVDWQGKLGALTAAAGLVDALGLPAKDSLPPIR